MLLQFICSYLQNQSWNASNNPPPDQNSPADQWPSSSPRPEQWVSCSTTVLDLLYVSDYILCDGLVLCIGLVLCDGLVIYVMDCVICIDVILVTVNYMWWTITACNDLCIYIYFCCICMEKQRKTKQKKKNSPLCRVFKPKHSAKGPAQVSILCRVLKQRHSAKIWKFAECPRPALGKIDTWPHPVAGPLPSAKVQHSGKVDTWRQPVAGTLPSVGRGPSAKNQTMPSDCR